MAFPQLFAFLSSQARLLWLRQVPVPAGPSVREAAAQPTQPSTCIPLPCVYTFSPSDPHRSAGSWWQESCSASAQLSPLTASHCQILPKGTAPQHSTPPNIERTHMAVLWEGLDVSLWRHGLSVSTIMVSLQRGEHERCWPCSPPWDTTALVRLYRVCIAGLP